MYHLTTWYAVIYDEQAGWNVHDCVCYRAPHVYMDAWDLYPQTNKQQQIKSSLWNEGQSPPLDTRPSTYPTGLDVTSQKIGA